MTTFRTYSKTDIIEGETTLSAARKTNDRFADILSWYPTTVGAAQHMVASFASGLTTFVYTHVLRSNVPLNHDAGNGSQYQALISDGDGTTSWQHMLRADGAVSLLTTGLAAGDVLYYNGTNFVRLAKGTNGQFFVQGASDAPTWQSISASTAPEIKTTNFSTAANAQFLVSTGVTTITLHAPAATGEQFSIMPRLGTRSFVTSTPTLSGAMQVNGAAIQAGYLNEDVRYNFISLDGTNWWVSGEVFDV